MIVEEGIVVGPVTDGRVRVETLRRSACGSCEVRSGCGTAAIGKVTGARRNVVTALAATDYRSGDRVELGLAEGALLAGSALLYLVPLAGLLIGAVAAAPFGETVSAAGGLGGLLFALWRTRLRARRIAHDPRFQPVILRRL